MSEKDDYKLRHLGWQNLAVSQLSTVNNFLLATATAFIGLIFKDEFFKGIYFTLDNFEYAITSYVISILFMSVSTLAGVIVLMARLKDFRITRHITLVRKNFFNHNDKSNIHEKLKKLSKSEFPETNILKMLTALFVRQVYMTQKEIEVQKSEFDCNKFNKLREASTFLGFLTWRATKYQVISFLISIFSYINYLIF